MGLPPEPIHCRNALEANISVCQPDEHLTDNRFVMLQAIKVKNKI